MHTQMEKWGQNPYSRTGSILADTQLINAGFKSGAQAFRARGTQLPPCPQHMHHAICSLVLCHSPVWQCHLLWGWVTWAQGDTFGNSSSDVMGHSAPTWHCLVGTGVFPWRVGGGRLSLVHYTDTSCFPLARHHVDVC